MSSGLRQQNEMRVAEEAAEWLGLLEHADQQQSVAFAKWVTESRRHVEEFLFATAIDGVLDRIDPQRRLDVAAILAQATTNVVPLDRITQRPEQRDVQTAGRKRWRLPGVIAASVVTLAVAVGLWVSSFGSPSYRTNVGEQRVVTLPDGSSIHLNTQSRARLHYSSSAREVELIEGEALFDVRRDTARPFRVRSGDAVIQALGTQFTVYRRNQGTTVAVIEGAIRISTQQATSQLVASPEKHVGEEARIASNGKITQHKAVEVARVAAWRQRRLMFRADTLEDIAAEFNRYNDTPKVRVNGEGVGKRRFTGIFNANDPRSLVQFLASYDDLTFEEKTDELLIRRR